MANNKLVTKEPVAGTGIANSYASAKKSKGNVGAGLATPKAQHTGSGSNGGYNSQYQDRIDASIDKVVNRKEFSYDPLQDVNYQAMAKLYEQKGNKAAKDTMADAAGLNGGYGTSYAATAAQQARNDYNQQLAGMVPELQQAAYDRYVQEHNMDKDAIDILQSADDSAYGRYRDTVSDNQWQQTYDRGVLESDRAFDYQKERDTVSDNQWQKTYDRDVLESDRAFDYQKERDTVSDNQWQQTYDRSVYESNRDFNYQKGRDATSDSQWQKEFNYQKERDKTADSQWAKEYALAKKDKSSGGSSNSGTPTYKAASSYDDLWNDNGGAVSGRAMRNEKARQANAGKTVKKASNSGNTDLFEFWKKSKKK